MRLPAGIDLVSGRLRCPGPHPARRCASWSWSASRRCTTTAPSAPPTSTSPSAPGSWCSCSARSARASPASSPRWLGWCQARARSDGTATPSQTRRRSCDPVVSPTSPRCRGFSRAPSPTTSGWTTPTGRCSRPWRPAACFPTSRPPAAPMRWSGTAGSGSPVARSSALRWPAPWRATRSCCWPTTSRRRWTPSHRDRALDALRQRGATVIGATSKRAALAQADRVVVLVEGRVAAVGAWSELSGSWGRLAG